MKRLASILFIIALAWNARAAEVLNLANDPWPPFIIEGEEQGTAEKLVCQALQRAGWACEIAVDRWQNVLAGARSGALDGIAAVWKSPDREAFLAFSRPYLTNRMVAVTVAGDSFDPDSLPELSGLTVALVADFAYGEEIDQARASMSIIDAEDDLAAIRLVQSGKARAAIIDELIARQLVEEGEAEGLELGSRALTFRELHFAVSKQHPSALEIIDDFNRSFQSMLEDGTVNEVLGIDWLVTDVGLDGDLDFVMRRSVSPDRLADPSLRGSVYAHDQSDYAELAGPEWQTSQPGYQVDGVEHDSLSAALESAFGRKKICGYEQWSSHIICTESRNR